MEDQATSTDSGTAPEAQSTGNESAPLESSATQAAAPASGPDLKKLLDRDKNDSNAEFTDAELDVLEKHYEEKDKSKSSPKPKTKATAPEKEEADAEGPDDESVTPENEDSEKDDSDPAKEEESDDSDTPEAKALMKEVGAKNLKDALAKVKELRKTIGGKDAQAVARVTKERDDLARGGRELWDGLKKGDANAIAFAEKNFGVKIQGQPQPAQNTLAQAVSEGDDYINPDLFIDPESAKLVNAAFKRQEEKLKALEPRFKAIEEERDRHIQEAVNAQNMMTVVDEMAQIAQYIPDLKGIGGFREAAQGFLSGKSDPRLEKYFVELFDIASEIPGASLKHAWDIKRGRDSDRIAANAKEQGRKEAYNVKPNPSLSGVTGGRGESSYTQLTDEQIEAMTHDDTLIPDHWFDKDENLIEAKIPKRARKAFGFK